MSVFMITLNQMIALFIIVIAGYILSRCGLMKTDWVNSLLKLLAMFFLPVMIFNCLQMDISGDLARKGIFFCVAYLILCLVAMALGLLGMKVFRIKDGAERCCWASCSWIPNIAFVGVPIIQVLLPPDALFYASLAIVVSLMLTFTLGIVVMGLCSKKDGVKVSPRLLLNPCTVALVLGLLTLFLNVELPTPVLSATGMISSATAPLAMLAVGAIMTRIPLGSIFTNWQVYVVMVIKLILVPVIAIFAIRSFAPDSVFLAAFLISAAVPMPAPLLATMTAHGGDLIWGTKFTVLSTLFSVITIPVLVYCFL